MNRRDFLRLRARGTERVLDLSCEILYMRYVDACASPELAAGGHGSAPRAMDATAHDGAPGSGEGPDWTSAWPGEPPTAIAVPTAADLFGDLERRLADADVLRVLGREWLAGVDFRREVESRIEAFTRRGGRVE